MNKNIKFKAVLAEHNQYRLKNVVIHKKLRKQRLKKLFQFYFVIACNQNKNFNSRVNTKMKFEKPIDTKRSTISTIGMQVLYTIYLTSTFYFYMSPL